MRTHHFNNVIVILDAGARRDVRIGPPVIQEKLSACATNCEIRIHRIDRVVVHLVGEIDVAIKFIVFQSQFGSLNTT